MKVVINDIHVPFDCASPEDMISAALKKRSITGDYIIYKKSVDARHAPRIEFVYSVICDSPKAEGDAVPFEDNSGYFDDFPVSDGTGIRPVIVGFGPCGMFCALLLAEKGYRPIVLEQGDDIDTRGEKVKRYFAGDGLDRYSNVQFGEGGAGSFSDGKLITRIKDSRCAYVLRKFAEFGAEKEITYLARPHIGTDKLKTIVKTLRERVISLGGEVEFGCRVIDIRSCAEGVRVVLSDGGELLTNGVFLALGHSARESYDMLAARGFRLEAKDFSIGLRIEHKRIDVEESLYGVARESRFASRLPAAEYNVSARYGERGVYSFCMCPGGTVVPSSSEEDGFVTNGMSNFARDGENSNSAIAVSVTRAEHGSDPFRGIAFQRELEKKAFALGGGKAPCQIFGDFLDGKKSTGFSGILPSCPVGTEFADLNELLPVYARELIVKGLGRFERQHSFFGDRRAILSGIESRTSSPVRIPRTETLEAEGFSGIYPCGEGAGYAGGITSAATDGLRAAESYMKKISGYQK